MRTRLDDWPGLLTRRHAMRLIEKRERITATLYAAVPSDVLDSLGLAGQALWPLDGASVALGEGRCAMEIALDDDLGHGAELHRRRRLDLTSFGQARGTGTCID